MMEINIAFALWQTSSELEDIVPLFPKVIFIRQDKRVTHLVMVEKDSQDHHPDGDD